MRGPASTKRSSAVLWRAELYSSKSSATNCIWPAANRTVSTREEPKVIIMMLHPVERTLSNYRRIYRLRLESRQLLQALLWTGHTRNECIVVVAAISFSVGMTTSYPMDGARRSGSALGTNGGS